MGKRQHSKDLLYITQTEWQTEWGGKKANQREAKAYKKLPFDCCGVSLRPFKTPVCTDEGDVFDKENILNYLIKYGKNPVTGKPLKAKELIDLHYHKNTDGEYICPVTFKVLNEHSHIVAIKPTGNVFSYDIVEQLNIKGKNMTDLISGDKFTKKDIITLQDPKAPARTIDTYHHVKTGADAADEEEDPLKNINQSDMMRRIIGKARQADAERKPSAPEMLTSAPLPRVDPKLHKAGLTADGQERKRTGFSSGMAAASFTSSSMNVVLENKGLFESDEEARQMLYRRIKAKSYVRLKTNLGMLNFELDSDKCPMTCDNFLRLCENGYYDGTVFHRSIKNFMIQGGDPTGTGGGGESIWKKAFPDEFRQTLKHSGRGVLAMANSGANTNGSQFYITFRSCLHLDNKHTVFGRLVGGMETLNAMEKVPTDKSDRPTSEIKILTAEIFVDAFAEQLKKERKSKEDKEDRQRREMDTDARWTTSTPSQPAPVTSSTPKSASVGRFLPKQVHAHPDPASTVTAATIPAASSTAASSSSTRASAAKDTALSSGDMSQDIPDIPQVPARKKMKTEKTTFGNFSMW
eukprot:Rmarinus@m.17936